MSIWSYFTANLCRSYWHRLFYYSNSQTSKYQ